MVFDFITVVEATIRFFVFDGKEAETVKKVNPIFIVPRGFM